MPAIFVSPHYDDVALSCGGTVAALARAAQEPVVLTVFASEVVEQMMGELATRKHARWNFAEPSEVADRRRAEDAAAARILGCRVRWLGMPDAIYRERYDDDARLFGPVDADELPLASHLARELRGLPEWTPGSTIYVPLGAGRHVDHQLCFELGRVLAQEGERVLAYEDVPYCIHTPASLDERLAELAPALGGPVLVEIGATLETRLQAIAEYRSQVPVIFRFTSDFRAAIRTHAIQAGAGRGPCERFWQLVPSNPAQQR